MISKLQYKIKLITYILQVCGQNEEYLPIVYNNIKKLKVKKPVSVYNYLDYKIVLILKILVIF